MNKTVLIGRLTKDVELRYTQDGKPVAKFTIAVDRQFKREGQPEADFIQIVVFGKVAENCSKYIGKGRLVGVAGRINTGSYADKEGKKIYTTDVIADEVQFLDKAKDGQGQQGQQDNSYYPNGFGPADSNDDLPF